MPPFKIPRSPVTPVHFPVFPSVPFINYILSTLPSNWRPVKSLYLYENFFERLFPTVVGSCLRWPRLEFNVAWQVRFGFVIFAQLLVNGCCHADAVYRIG